MKLPQEFIERSKMLIDSFDAFLFSLDTNPPVSIRINPLKWGNRVNKEKVPWTQYGYYLNNRPSFTFDPLFHSGVYYVQEASSMFIEQVFDRYVKNDAKILDLCAAPGGKSTHIGSLISNNSLLVSNEVIRSRADILSENIIKTGYSNNVITNNDPSDFKNMGSFFDVILIDAPCSGEGMFRKDIKARDEWSVSNVMLCQKRQRRILADIWNSLKPEGLLIYSTCTYNREENEDNVLWIKETLGAETLELPVQAEWMISPSIDKNISAYRFFPHKTNGEGFFMAVLRKKSESRPFKKRNKDKGIFIIKSENKKLLSLSDEFTFFSRINSEIAFPSILFDDLKYLSANLKVVSAGVNLGQYKGKDFIPDQGLALSSALNDGVFQEAEIDYETAIRFLRKEVLYFPDLPKGYILLRYGNKPLGFVKNLGNRANNLYPSEWRIRTGYVPDNIEHFLKL